MWSEQCWMIRPAPVPNPAPVWMLPSAKPRFSDRSMCFKRPFTCTSDCKRWHAGIDLRAAGNTQVVAAERCSVIAGSGGVERGWTAGTKSLFCRNAASWAVYGGIKPGSADALGLSAGAVVEAGSPLGVIAPGYDMLHFELYDGDVALKGNQRWWADDPPPPALRDPLNYVQSAAGQTPTLGTIIQRHEALQLLGFYVGPASAPWGERSVAALVAAQAALGSASDGVWGPETDARVRRALGGRLPAPERRAMPSPRTLARLAAVAFAAGLAWGAYRVTEGRRR